MLRIESLSKRKIKIISKEDCEQTINDCYVKGNRRGKKKGISDVQRATRRSRIQKYIGKVILAADFRLEIRSVWKICDFHRMSDH